MKLNFDIKNKKAGFEADVEKIVEKGMDQQEKSWKDKFNTMHNAKKEMLEIKHKQKLEIEENNQRKKSWFEKMEEEKRKTRQLEIEEEIRKENERKKSIKVKIIISFILGLVGIAMMITGIILTSVSGNPDSAWGMLIVIGLFICMSIAFLWMNDTNNKKGTKK